MSNFISIVTIDELYRIATGVCFKDISNQEIYKYAAKAVKIVMDYQVLLEEVNLPQDMLTQITLVIFHWLYIDKHFGSVFSRYLPEFIKKIKSGDFSNYKYYHTQRERFWQEWCILRTRFPECWQEGNWNENVQLYKLKKDLLFRVQKYLNMFNGIEDIRRHSYHPLFPIYVSNDHKLLIKNWN